MLRSLACYGMLAGVASWAACGDSEQRAPELAARSESWPRYESAWFSVRYPEGFAVRPSLPSEDGGFDSVFFEAPDGRASFYVLSPQWGRKATDVALRPERERELSVERTETERGTRTVRTIATRDGGITRIVEENSEEGGSVYWVTAFEFRDEAARRSYGDAYQRFKASLEQFSD
ncbi:MAG: hypothetical protein ACR2P8_12975 [Myxococcota bacterium]